MAYSHTTVAADLEEWAARIVERTEAAAVTRAVVRASEEAVVAVAGWVAAVRSLPLTLTLWTPALLGVNTNSNNRVFIALISAPFPVADLLSPSSQVISCSESDTIKSNFYGPPFSSTILLKSIRCFP